MNSASGALHELKGLRRKRGIDLQTGIDLKPCSPGLCLEVSEVSLECNLSGQGHVMFGSIHLPYNMMYPYNATQDNIQGIHLARKLDSQTAWLSGKACTSKDIGLKNSP